MENDATSSDEDIRSPRDREMTPASPPASQPSPPAQSAASQPASSRLPSLSFQTASQATPARSNLRGNRPVRTPISAPSTGGRRRGDLANSRRNLQAILNLQGRSGPPTGEGGSGLDEADTDAEWLGVNRVWGTVVDVPTVVRSLQRFLRHFQEPGATQPKYVTLLEQCCADEMPVLNVDCHDIFQSDEKLYSQLVNYPSEVAFLLDDEARSLARGMQSPEGFWSQLVTKPYNLLETKVIRDLNPSDIEKLISVSGMVTRTSNIIPELRQAVFKCQKCDREEIKEVVPPRRIDEPTKCPNPICGARWSMSLQHDRSVFFNKQIVRMQESPNDIPAGETPHNVTMVCYDEMVDSMKAGDRVTITGIFIAAAIRTNPRIRRFKSVFRTYIDILNTRREEPKRAVTNEEDVDPDPEIMGESTTKEAQEAQEQEFRLMAADENIYERLVASFAPSIWELDDIKKGLLCLLFGGQSKAISGGKIRGELNILMVGDPGVAKSQLLSFAHRLSSRGIYTSGRSSSAVGLTAYVTKDAESKDRVLESGALVLSDKGVCCIDEFDKMTDMTRSVLHEVMEQQTVSVAKAGIIAQLNARTSVLAAANPVGSKYNDRLSIIENIQMPASLVSRFDLIYLLLDRANEDQDKQLARHLVSLMSETPPAAAQGVIPLETLKQYIKFAKETCKPELNDEAADFLIKTYVDMRSAGNFTKTITATPRQLESMVRISEALAKMRLSNVVEQKDAEEAVRLVKDAMHQAATDPNTGLIDMDIIQTGMSRRDREERENLAQEIIKLLEVQPEGVTGEELLQKLANQSSAILNLSNVNAAVKLKPDQIAFEVGRYRLKYAGRAESPVF